MPIYFAAYSRVSLDEQRKGISPTDQVDRILQWTQNNPHGFALAQYGTNEQVRDAVFYEDYTGFEYERPEMDIVRDLARRGVINAVIVLRTDRFARDEAVFLLLERFFKKHNVRLFSVEEGEFTPGVINRFVAAMQRARAEDDAESAKKRMREARHAYLKSGIPQAQGVAVYGYTKQGAKRETCYIIHEEQAGVVRLIYYLFVVERYAIIQIAQHLMDMGIPCPSVAKRIKHPNVSGKWSRRTVRQILENSAYRGTLKGYKSYSEGGERHHTDPEQQAEISVPPIIDEEMWQQAQYLLVSTKSGWLNRNRTRDYLLSGTVGCICGCGMVASSGVGTHGIKKYFYYRCNSYNRLLGRPDCGNKKVIAEDLESTVWDFIEQLTTDPQTTIALYEQDQQEDRQGIEETKLRIVAVDELVLENREELRRLNLMYQKNRCDEAYYEAEFDRLTREHEALVREREKAEKQLKSQQVSAHQFEQLRDAGEDIRQNSTRMDFTRKRRLLERLRVHVTVDRHAENRSILIEVLGYRQRVSLKNSSARSGRRTEPGPPPHARRYAGAENGRPVRPDRPPRLRRRTHAPG